jgi:type IV pilus biogenesis protein CpaD/CtpE
MLTLDASYRLPACVSFTIVQDGAILLNTQTNKYYALEEVGRHLWELMSAGKSLRDSYQALLREYEVESAQLEQDVLELVEDLRKHGLVEIVPA